MNTLGGSTPPEAPPTLNDLLKGFDKLPWFWQLLLLATLAPLMGSLMGPAAQELRNIGFQRIPDVPLSPADLAAAIVRGFIPWDNNAQNEAAQNGVNPQRFATLIQLAGASIDPQQAAEALRRGIIPQDSGNPDQPGFQQAIAQGNLRDMWGPVLQALALALPSPTNALAALLEGQTDEQTARALYQAWGGALTQNVPNVGELDIFQLMFDTQGSAPTPTEAAVMANRGIIPWSGTGPDVVSFEQAFLEGPWRNKWLKPYQLMSQYFPPPRTITAMVKEGSLTHDQAAQLLRDQGLPPDLVSAYIESASAQKLAGTKDLGMSTITTLYFDGLVSDTDALTMLESLGYGAPEAKFILAIQDIKREQQALSQAVSRVHTLFTGHKIDATAATNALNALQLPAAQVQGLLQTWALERQANVRIPTEAQIADAWEYSIITQAEALAQLQQLGYSAADAWLVLSVKNKGPLPNAPPGVTVPAAPKA